MTFFCGGILAISSIRPSSDCLISSKSAPGGRRPLFAISSNDKGLAVVGESSCWVRTASEFTLARLMISGSVVRITCTFSPFGSTRSVAL